MTEDEIVEAMWREIDYLSACHVSRQGVRKALRIALPWAREQALREAAAVCEDYERDGQNTKAYACETADELAARILALIPYRPSQETTDE